MKNKFVKFIIVIVVIGIIVAFNMMINSNVKIKHEETEDGHGHDEGPKILDATLEMGKVFTFETEKGSFDIVLMQRDIPNTCSMFAKFAGGSKYDGVKFAEVNSWMVRSDFPNADFEPIENEMATGISSFRGAVGMAKGNKSHKTVPSFFIVKECSPSCSEYFTFFGFVIKGMDTVDKLTEEDTIKNVTKRRATKEDEASLIALIKQGTKDAKAVGMVSAQAQEKMMHDQMRPPQAQEEPAPEMVN